MGETPSSAEQVEPPAREDDRLGLATTRSLNRRIGGSSRKGGGLKRDPDQDTGTVGESQFATDVLGSYKGQRVAPSDATLFVWPNS